MKQILFFLGVLIFVQPISAGIKTDSIKNKEIKEITVYSNLDRTLALPMVVVDQKTIQASSFFTPAEALQRETGIALSRDGSWATSVNVRGLSEQRLLFLVDEDRIQTATDIAAALSSVDMSSLAKIEVIKGASSVLYGTGAMGGVVNFVSARPTYTANFQTKGEITSGFNTVNNLWANNASLQFTTKQWYLALNGSFRTAQNMQTPEGKLANSQFHDASWGLKAGILYAPNQEFLVNYQHFGAWDVGLPGGSAFPATAVVRYVGVDRNQLSGEYIFSKINTYLREVRLKAYTQNISRDVENIVNPTTTILPSSLNRTWGAKATADWIFEDNHTLEIGAEGWERKAETTRLKIKTTSDSTYTVWGEQPTPNAKMVDVGVFAHYSWKIVPHKLAINVGLRLDYIQMSNDSVYNPVFQYSVKKGIRTDVKNLARNVLFLPDNQDDLSYAAHLDFVYNFSSQQQLALSVSNSYRIASIEERFKYIDLAGDLHVGNPNLKPEKGAFSNLNYTYSVNKFNLKVDVFVHYLTNLITEKKGTYVYRTGSGAMISSDAFVNTNVNKALFWGAELEGNWHITTCLKFSGNTSYTRARDVDANTFLPQIPPLHGFLSLTYRLKHRFEASFSSLWAAKQSEVAVKEPTTDGHVIYNFDVHTTNIALNNSYLQLFAGVDNILDKSYYNHLSTTRGMMRMEPGRNIYLKAKWGW